MPISGPAPAAAPARRPPAGGGRYPHALILIQAVQASDAGDPLEDDYGQPIAAPPVETPFRGWLQPASSIGGTSTEANQANQAGEVATRFLLFAPMSLPITKNDTVRWDVDGDTRRYNVEGQPLDAAGRGHHLEVSLRLQEA